MKTNRLTSGLCTIVTGLLLAFGPWFLFRTCGADVKVMKCFWSCKAELALGILFVILGIFTVTMKDGEDIRRMSAMSVAMSVTAVCIPAFIIGGCMKPDMACRVSTFPSIYVISAINSIVQAVIIFIITRNKI